MMVRASLAALAVMMATAPMPAATATLPSAADVAAVRRAYHDYAAALAAGDIDAAKRLSIGDASRARLIDGRRAAVTAERQYLAAAEKAFPGAAVAIGYGVATTRPADTADPEQVSFPTAETAIVTVRDAPESVRLRRAAGTARGIEDATTAGGWHIDLNAMYTPETVDEVERFRGALVETMRAITGDIAAGRFQSYAAVQADLETRVKMRIASPEPMTTTRPAG